MLKKIVITILGFLVLAFPARARGWEYYFEYKTKVLLNESKKIFLNLKQETRYKHRVNYYRKSSFGVSKKITPDWNLAFYYAFKGKRKDDWHALHMFWTQADYKKDFKKFAFASSVKFERHCSQNTYKFREKLKLIFPLNKKFSFWFGDEARLFSFLDDPYFGENESLCGLNLNFFKSFPLSIYYDLRRIKEKGEWESTNCLRTVLSFKF